jgi:hypothetical protein
MQSEEKMQKKVLSRLEFAERLLSTSNGFFGGFFVDLVGVDGHIGEDAGDGAGDLYQTFPDGHFGRLATFKDAQLPWEQSGDEIGVGR